MEKEHQRDINDNPITLSDLTEPVNKGTVKEEEWREPIEFENGK